MERNVLQFAVVFVLNYNFHHHPISGSQGPDSFNKGLLYLAMENKTFLLR